MLQVDRGNNPFSRTWGSLGLVISGHLRGRTKFFKGNSAGATILHHSHPLARLFGALSPCGTAEKLWFGVSVKTTTQAQDNFVQLGSRFLLTGVEQFWTLALEGVQLRVNLS